MGKTKTEKFLDAVFGIICGKGGYEKTVNPDTGEMSYKANFKPTETTTTRRSYVEKGCLVTEEETVKTRKGKVLERTKKTTATVINRK